MKNAFSFYVIPDLHMIPPGLDLPKEKRLDQRCLLETPAIHEAVFKMVLEDTSTDVIIVPGDLTNSGEKEAHTALVEELKAIEKAGKKIFVISAAHDYCEKTRFEEYTPTEREELPGLYKQFMHYKAVSIAPDGHTYSAMLNDKIMILALNDDKKPGQGVKGYGFDNKTVEWIKEQCFNAKENCLTVVAMTHHPLLPPNSLYPVIALGDMITNWQETASLLADNGVKYMFTGHSHMHNVAEFVSPSGNKIYDINTASIVGYPHAFRKVTIDDNGMNIKTLETPTYSWPEIGDRTSNEYAYDNCKRMLDDKVLQVTSGGEGLANVAGIKGDKRKKLMPALNIASKILDTLTIKKLGGLLCCKKKIPDEIGDRYFKDVIIELILAMYHGDESYTPETPMYKALDAVFSRIEGICTKLGKTKVCDIMKSLRGGFLYNVGPDDWNVHIS